MNKRHLHHYWRHFRRIKPWYFLVIALLSAVICVMALRSNYQHMTELRDAVYSADKNNGDVVTTLQKLQGYVSAHMNTELSSGTSTVYPPIQLKYTYDRLVQARSAATAKANGEIYTQAQAYCEQQNSTDFSGHNRVPCIEQYVQSHTVASAPIADDLYKFDFVSPTWSPDLAGWSMVAAAVSAVLFVLSFITRRYLK